MLSGTAVIDTGDDDGASDERTSLVPSIIRTGAAATTKTHRKYGTTSTSSSSLIMNNSSFRLHQPTSFMHHPVQSGDTLQGIALRYKTTVENIKRINKMWSNDTLFLRDFLLVPAPSEEAEFSSNGSITGSGQGLVLTSSDTRGEMKSRSAAAPKGKFQHSRAMSMDSDAIVTDSVKSIQDYLGNIDSRIKEAKTKAQKLQNSSEVLKDLPEVNSQSPWSRSRASSRLRLSLSDLGAEFNAATNSSSDQNATIIMGSTSTEFTVGTDGRRRCSRVKRRLRARDMAHQVSVLFEPTEFLEELHTCQIPSKLISSHLGNIHKVSTIRKSLHCTT
nr:EOG090X0DPX [Sida crystallina]